MDLHEGKQVKFPPLDVPVLDETYMREFRLAGLKAVRAAVDAASSTLSQHHLENASRLLSALRILGDAK